MNTNIVISLDTRRAKKDGTFPLVMRLGHNGKTTSIPLGTSLHEKHWNEKDRLVKSSFGGVTSVTRLNNQIQKKKAEAMDVILKLDEAGQLATLSITALRDRLDTQGTTNSFFSYSEKLIDNLRKANRIGTARSYNDVINVLKGYCKDKDLTFQQITYDFLNKFAISHTSKGNSVNGLAVYMRTIRAIYNKAIKDGIIEKEFYPFDDYKIKTIPTKKRALDAELLKVIIEKKLEQTDICFNARNYFLASYMMYGMNFTDMAFLKRTDIINGRINYRRSKTSKLYDIKITQNLNEILTYYLNKDKESEYVFPIIKREKVLLQYKDIEWARKRYNKKLKKLATLCGIEHNLTSYVSRHSFATQAMLQQVPLQAISAMLGHSSLKTTEIYLKTLPSNILDDYNAKVLLS